MTKETKDICYRALVRWLTDLEEKKDQDTLQTVQNALAELEKERAAVGNQYLHYINYFAEQLDEEGKKKAYSFIKTLAFERG